MTEETHDAARSGPRGIVMSIVVSLIAGWVLLIGVTFAIQNYDSDADYADRRAAGADLHRRGRRHRRQAAAAHRDRRPAVLRHGVGDRELADDLRVLPRRRAARLALLAPDQHAHPDARPTRSGWPPAARSSWACPTCGTPPRTPRSPRSRSSASTSPTCCRRSCGCARATRSSAGPWHLGRWSRLIGIDRGGLGGVHHRPVHAAARSARSPRRTSTTRRSPCSSSSASPASGGWSRRRTGSPGPKVQGTAGGTGRGRAGAGEPCLTGKRRRPAPSRTCVTWSTTARSTPSCSPSPTCRAGCRASGCTRRFFLDVVLEHATEGCNYLLAVDVDMNTVDGYAMSSWSSGYGDFVMQPGPVARCGRCPGSRARCWCWPTCRGRTAARSSPRRGRSSPGRRPGWPTPGWPPTSAPSWSSSSSGTPTSRPGRRGYRDLTPANQYNVDYSMLGTARIEPLLRRIRNEMAGAGLVVESAKGECNLGQHEIAFRYAEALTDLRRPRRSTRTGPRRSPPRRAWR